MTQAGRHYFSTRELGVIVIMAALSAVMRARVETTLFSAQGITAIPISLLEGVILKASLILLGKRRVSVIISGDYPPSVT